MSDDSIKQEFLTELDAILESDEAYGSNIQVLTYSVKDETVSGKFRDSWSNRVYEFIIDINGISYKPAAKLDSFLADEAPVRFDAFSEGYVSLFEDSRLDRTLTGKRTKKPKCGVEAFGCGYSCINLLKTCRITPSGKKIGGNQGSSIGKERLIKLVELARKYNNEGDKTKALSVFKQAKGIKTERDKYKEKGNERKAERNTQREIGQSADRPKLNGTHDLIPLFDHDEFSNNTNNFKHPEVINKISKLTGMTESESRASARAVNAFSDEDYEKIRKAEYAGIETSQTKAINRYLDKMPKFEGEIFRGRQYKTQQDIDNLVRRLKEGDDYELPAMSSFSSDIETATTFAVEGAYGLAEAKFSMAVIFKVASNKSGVTIKNISANQEEDEVLVKKGTRYKINGTIETLDHKGKKVTIVPLKEY
jgi:hypothetical protein